LASRDSGEAAGLARFARADGLPVVEVNRPDRSLRRQGKVERRTKQGLSKLDIMRSGRWWSSWPS
jgi:hypothetical protein